jgi:hypothetical protein
MSFKQWCWAFGIAIMLAIPSKTFALIIIPDGACTFQGRWLINETSGIKVYTFIINEKTGGEKRFRIKSVTDDQLLAKEADGKLVELRVLIKKDSQTSDSNALLLKRLRFLSAKEALSYFPSDFKTSCTRVN